MKKKVFAALTVVFALCLAITVYAFNQSSNAKTSADCCAKKDSCPMKNKQAENAEKTSCCDQDDCCCKGGSCPMKMAGEKTSEGKECCSQGGSCPMKKEAEKQAATVDMTNVTVVTDGESCCKPGADCCQPGASCCKGKHG